MDHHNHNMDMSMDMTTDGTGMPPMEMIMEMPMYFEFKTDVTILFFGWKVTSVGGLIGSMIGIFFLAIIYEALKYFREYLFKKSYASARYSAVGTPNGTPKVVDDVQRSIRNRILSPNHFAQTALHVIQVTLSYFLMLIFMTYNAWLCIAVVVGAGVGFFIFGWKKTIVVDITEHCH